MCEPVCRSSTSGANSGEFQKRSADSRSGNSRMIAPSGGVSKPSICVGSPPCTKNRPSFAAIRALVFGRYSASQSRCEIRSRPTMYAAIAGGYSPTETRQPTGAQSLRNQRQPNGTMRCSAWAAVWRPALSVGQIRACGYRVLSVAASVVASHVLR